MITKSLEIHFLHSSVQAHHLKGRVAVPIDVLRANTTMTTALANGAKSVYPFATVDLTQQFKLEQGTNNDGEDVLCGGEREAKIIDGFDLGNSPFEYSSERVKGRTIAFTTTNGTLTINACKNANVIMLGSFVNLGAIVRRLTTYERVAMVCAGTDGDMTSEDILFSGAVAEMLCKQHGFQYANTQSHLALNIARTFWQTALRQIEAGDSLADILKLTLGGRNLVKAGFDRDVEYAAEIDKFDLVPILSSGGIVLS